MLISQRHGFLFVHVAKTGGTSVRAVLRSQRWNDPRDWLARGANWLNACSGHRGSLKLPRHAPILVAREMLAPATFQSLFKFAFVRNPWDRLVSAYAHFQREHSELLRQYHLVDFADFVDFVLTADPSLHTRGTLVRAVQRPQLELLVGLQGELLLDYVGRFENLSADLHEVCTRIDWPLHRLPHCRRSDRAEDYRTSYSDQLAERVGRHYADDAAAFQYTFDPLPTCDVEPGPAGSSCVRAIAGRVPCGLKLLPVEGIAEC